MQTGKRALAWGVLATVMLAGVAQSAPPILPGNQQLVIPHVGGRVLMGTSTVRQQNGVILATTATYQWPGTYFEAAFNGSEISLRLNDSANILTVTIDGQLKDTLNRPGEMLKTYGGLSSGQHVIRLDRLTETQDSMGTFEGFFAPAGPMLAIQPHPRQIEFIGDSYTAGYGNTSTKRECSQDEVWATTDTQQAFGPMTARHYSADYQINAYSGIGIVRNYNGVAPRRSMPLLYRSALIEDETVHAYADTAWNPQIVVIALGGNDFSTPVHAGEKWTSLEDLRAGYIAGYVAFVKQVRATHPAANFVLMAYGQDEVINDTAEVIRRLNADGETRVSAFSTGAGFGLTGCDWHLDLKDDQRIRDALIGYFDAHKDLWKGK